MASISLSEFAKENMQALPDGDQARIQAILKKISMGGIHSVASENIPGALSKALLLRVSHHLRLLAIRVDEDTWLIDDVFSKKSVFASANTPQQRRKRTS